MHSLIRVVGDTTPPQNIVCPACREHHDFRLLWLGDLSQAFTQIDNGERDDYDSHDNEGDFLNLEIQITCGQCDAVIMERPVTITVDPWQYWHPHDDSNSTRIPGVQRIIAATEALRLYDNTP